MDIWIHWGFWIMDSGLRMVRRSLVTLFFCSLVMLIFLFACDAVYLDVHFACAGSCKVPVSVHGVFWGRAPCMHIAVKSGSLTV